MFSVIPVPKKIDTSTGNGRRITYVGNGKHTRPSAVVSGSQHLPEGAAPPHTIGMDEVLSRNISIPVLLLESEHLADGPSTGGYTLYLVCWSCGYSVMLLAKLPPRSTTTTARCGGEPVCSVRTHSRSRIRTGSHPFAVVRYLRYNSKRFADITYSGREVGETPSRIGIFLY